MLFCEPQPVLVARGKGWEEKPLVGCCLLRAYLLGERRPPPSVKSEQLETEQNPGTEAGVREGGLPGGGVMLGTFGLGLAQSGSRAGSSESGGQVWVLVAGMES